MVADDADLLNSRLHIRGNQIWSINRADVGTDSRKISRCQINLRNNRSVLPHKPWRPDMKNVNGYFSTRGQQDPTGMHLRRARCHRDEVLRLRSVLTDVSQMGTQSSENGDVIRGISQRKVSDFNSQLWM